MDRSVHARKLRLDASRRIIAISDIHGNDALLKRLLQKVDYQPQNDVLLLLGAAALAAAAVLVMRREWERRRKDEKD